MEDVAKAQSKLEYSLKKAASFTETNIKNRTFTKNIRKHPNTALYLMKDKTSIINSIIRPDTKNKSVQI